VASVTAEEATRVVMIGLDALDPKLLLAWIDELPTFRSMIENGTFGSMRSTIPPLTIPAWVTMLTGRKPATLGNFGLVDIKRNYSTRPVDPASWRGQYVWDLIGARKGKVGVLGVPFLASPYHVNGFLITDPAWGDVKAFPEHISTKLNAETACGPTWRQMRTMWLNIEKEKHFILDVLENAALDFFFFALPAIDSTMHWGGTMRECKDAYKRVDSFLSDILSACKNCQVFVVSDHGCKETAVTFNVPTYLARLGLLRFTESRLRMLRAELAQTAMMFLYRIPKFRLLLTNLSVILIRRTWRHALWRPTLLQRIDLAHSQLFPAGVGGSWFGIWINRVNDFDLGWVQAGNEKELQSHLTMAISNLRDPERGRLVVKSVLTREELGYRERSRFPDLAVQLADPYVPTFEDLPSSLWLHIRQLVHSDYGVFLAIGPGIRRKRRIDGIEIIDVAPTVLHTLGMAIPKHMPGRVLREIFEEKSGLATRDDKREGLEVASGLGDSSMSKEDEERIADRLRALGYLS
jgi:predicted AlkP superfamily phosphohydrolase/phosphomutase